MSDEAIEDGATYALNDKAKDPLRMAVVSKAHFTVEGKWKDLTGKSWMFSDGNPACLHYAMRIVLGNMPIDNNVYYGKIDGLGHLVHATEIGEKVE